MLGQTFEVSEAPVITVTECLGELHVRSSRSKQVTIRADDGPGTLDAVGEGDALTFSARGDCSIDCPVETQLIITQVRGDVGIRGVLGRIDIDNVSGDVVLRGVGQARLGGIAGDLNARGMSGDLHVDSVSADARLRGIEGLATLSQVGGDLNGRGLQGGLITEQVGADVRQLQDILQSPKLRGNLGEWSLETLLADVLPRAHYELQYHFADNTVVDALVRLAQGSVCIDAKFPLTEFRHILEAEDDQARQKARKAFLRDVRAHIDAIAAKYIQPQQGTLDFALMYVPAENVYYEAMLAQDDLDVGAYGRSKKVIPVSPNTLYAYLMAIAAGLRGLQIERNAQHILHQLSQLTNDLSLFTNDFAVVGRHLTNAQARFADAQRKIEVMTLKLDQMHDHSLEDEGASEG